MAREPQNGILGKPPLAPLLDEAHTLATRVPRSQPRHPIVSLFRSTLGSLFAALFPSECRLCGIPLIAPTTLPVCQGCIDAIVPFEIPRCGRCGEALVAGFRAQLPGACCNNCVREQPLFERAVAFASYDGALRDLIHMLKYKHMETAADVLGSMLAETIAPLESDFVNASAARLLVIPVPLHISKLRQRGFNQSELLAASAVKRLRKRPGPIRYQVESSALVRRRATESQVGLTREQRQANMRGAFAVSLKNRIAGNCVLLVDDVFTTGTTVGECARVLLKAGAKKVWVSTVARALRETEALDHHSHQREEQAQTLAT